MDRFSAELDKLGGKLVVTTRTPYFRDMVKNRMFASTQELNVPEWLEVERNEILAAKHIDSKELNEDVAKSLLNPRLLAIALQLLDSAEIGVLEELSVSRLLFEHMRNSEKDSSVPRPAREFARQLSHHAEEVVNRVESNAMDDLMVFRKEIESVVDGRFFQDVAGDPGSYTIEENGLDLALAFSVISKLSRALRNNHDVDAELRKILEPVEALDRTAKVVQAAVTISAIDEDCSIEVGAALIYALAELQNIDDTDFDAFSSLAVKRIGLFLCAAKSLCLAEGNQQNYDWVELALLKARAIEAVWDEIRTTISYWFRKHSLSPELGMMKHRNRDSEEEVEKELGKNKKRLEEKLNSLSDHERKMLEYLQERYGGLLPAEPSQRAKVRLLASYADSTLGRAIRDVIFEKRGRPEAEWDQQRLAQGHQAWLDALPYLAQQLRQQRFFGEHYSLADMVLSARMGLAYGYGLKIPDSLPNLQQWFARMTTLPAFQKTAPPVVLEKLAATVEADTVQDYV